MICNLLTGFIQAYICRNQGTDEEVSKFKQFFSQYGYASSIRYDSGPAFRKEFAKQMGLLGVKVTHSSAYKPASNGCAEYGIKTCKEQLKKHGLLSHGPICNWLKSYLLASILGFSQVNVTQQCLDF